MSEPIRVLHVVTHMNRGGLETMIMNYYRHIDRSKIQFDFLTHRDDCKKDYDDEILGLGGKIYHLPPMNPFDKKGYLKKLDEFFAEHKEYKIVHSHLDCMSAIPLKYAKKHGVPVRIAHAHSTSEEKKDLKYLVKLHFKRQISQYATELFACGEKAGKWMFGDRTFTIMKNAIDAQKFIYNPETADRVRYGLGIRDNQLIVGHVGRFCIPKNHEFLIDIFHEIYKQNSNAILILVGMGELEERIEEKVTKLNLQKAVRFMGLREDIPDLLQAMDVFVFPSLYEGLPVTLVEAQAAGLPCVVSASITREIQITENIEYIPLENESPFWAEEILKLELKKKNTFEEIKKAGFDIYSNARWLEDIYLKR